MLCSPGSGTKDTTRPIELLTNSHMCTIGYIAVALARPQILKLLPTSYIIISRSIRKIYVPLSQFVSLTPRSQEHGTPSVHDAACLFQKLCYDNKDALSAGIIVAGWDEEAGPSVYNIPLGGGLFRQPWAIGGLSSHYLLVHLLKRTLIGSGSTYVYGYCDATYQEGWGKDETINFVRNSTPTCRISCRWLTANSNNSSGTGNVARWLLWWGYPHVCHHGRWRR